MRVELALFDGATLLDRGEVTVSVVSRIDKFMLFQVNHHLGPEAAHLILNNFADHMGITKSTLTMPVHESEDWESIELEKYTLAFWCRLDA
jgi:hypothetical protein